MRTLHEIAQESHELEMTPMIDVTFLLLIFFLLTLKFKVLEGKLSAYLPRDAGGLPSTGEVVEPVTIRIEVAPGQAGQKRFASGPLRGEPWHPERGLEGSSRRFQITPGSRKLDYHVGPRHLTDLGALGRRLTELHRLDPERPALVDARPGTCAQDVIGVLDGLVEAGFEAITFAVGAEE